MNVSVCVCVCVCVCACVRVCVHAGLVGGLQPVEGVLESVCVQQGGEDSVISHRGWRVSRVGLLECTTHTHTHTNTHTRTHTGFYVVKGRERE